MFKGGQQSAFINEFIEFERNNLSIITDAYTKNYVLEQLKTLTNIGYFLITGASGGHAYTFEVNVNEKN